MPADRRSVWAALAWGATILASIELWRCVLFPRARQISQLGELELAAGIWSMTIVPLLVHLGPLALVLDRTRPRLALGTAAAFGLWWHVGVVQGDGIRSLDFYWPLRLAIAAAAAIGLAAFTRLVLLPPATQRIWLRHALALAVVVVGVRVNLHHFTLYREFQGLLVVFLAIVLAWLVMPLSERRWFRPGAIGIAGLAFASALAGLPDRALVEGHVRRLTRVTGPLIETLPLSRALLSETEPLVDPEQPISPEQRAAFARAEADRAVEPHPPRGENVILIVLESVRSDVWNDPRVTPRFHAWRRRGVHFPVGIAQYPATPLAYGAMFTGQYPSVLAQSPHWGEHRVFAELEPDFDRLILTRPDIEWFDHNAVSSFFLDEGTAQARHDSAAEGLEYLREEIQVASAAGHTFFAWAHLYEPHEPYLPRAGYRYGDDARALYEGEVRYLDEALGDFLEWFWVQPEAADTLVVVLGDHGEGLGEVVFGEPFSGHHVHVDTVVSHVPVFLAGAGLPAGVVREDVRPAQIDLIPTLFDYLGEGIPTKYHVQGRSIFDQLAQPSPRTLVTEAFAIRGHDFFDFVAAAPEQEVEEQREAFRELNEIGSYSPKLGLERDGWQLVYDTMMERAWLYDLRRDPFTEHDLAAREPERLAALMAELQTWRARQAWVLEQLEAM